MTITVYADAGEVVTTINGTPPVDQSSQLAALTQQVLDLQTDNAQLRAAVDAGLITNLALQSKIDAAKAAAQAAKDADAATTDGQSVLDALA